ncbi:MULTISPECIES: type II CRISPR RNA-guided endonuclease Cas9 [Corynebacterium]|uniref:type II CRISPR RNA-guided endonuclease Cas9 n=2 Tax=Corynebacteriaceae TaxID=1653 RepID=UPI00254F32C5|nr:MULTISPECIES: type II CRISPR RNA-guided endonuclease Cas9 [unclassified Corynebacterium]MDK8453231.1 HNH endonuclease [Corynebacterium sp. MSK084]MDK8467870.1 HNH endonuclease [Corynebacterium sp. MSK130]MDK8492203.1 HNH endonuclease [Corynebacterium sp. MSK175]MDK8515161.1 HNH endonuclease [Corynebacterium sp. MSK123]MDK8548387.1 HNH endonuclease [Corynebacterium sp. MSK222]
MSLLYRVGIDVGTYSLGCTAIEVDDNDQPVSILSSVSLIHDSGLDPDQQKRAVTRLASSGVARRTRRLYRRRRRRMVKLENFLTAQGWETLPFERYSDPYLPWHARVALVNGYISDDTQRGQYLSIAFRHIANHRGWRNPYWKVSSLYSPDKPSDAFEQIRKELEASTGRQIPETATVGQLISFAQFGKDRLRGGGKQKDKKKPQEQVNQAVISARLHQIDHAREINEICRVQKIDDTLRKQILDLVFAAESPKGAQKGRVGKDPLQPKLFRALKASDAFQQYRIAALTGNLRIYRNGVTVPLDRDEKLIVFNYLVNLPKKEEPSWLKIAEILNIERGQLRGTATMTDDGERAGATPPVHDTNRTILDSKVKSLAHWWENASDDERAAMLKSLSNSEVEDFDSPAGAQVQAFFTNLDETEQEKLDSLHLPMGRAAYSEDTLMRLTNRMLDENLDLYEARLAEFGIPKDWTPPAPRIGEPVGNPAVDRVLKGVARWLEAAADEWGAPKSVVIEHVRDGFVSKSKAIEIDRANNNRHKRSRELFQKMQENLGIEGKVRSSDLWRYQSVQRQNCQCAYCGSPITYTTCEMDHIVPRAGEGSTNTRDNLVATCHRCNLAKKNIPFAVWAEKSTIPGVSVKEALDRTRHWSEDSGMSKKDFQKFRKSVCERLNRTVVDEPLDARSMESVAWMANELRGRVAQRFQEENATVNVYRGALTAEARRAAGITDKLRFIDGTGKSRLDRRHHAVDAAVVAFIHNYVAETLAIRSNKKREAQLLQGTSQWKEFTGSDDKHRAVWNAWIPKMQKLAVLLQIALDEDRIVVTSNLRLRLGNGRAHEDTISELKTIRVGDAISVTDIDRASSEALWCALTREPDFDEKDGLPENPNRRIRVHGTWYDAEDEIEVFPVGAGAIKVRGGYAKLSRFHHARVYKIPGKKAPIYCMLRVYNTDLVQHRHEDLFSVELKPQTMSVRQAEPKLRKALAENTAEYLGWLVTDDELIIDTSTFRTGLIEEMQSEFSLVRRWRLDGFDSPSLLTLRPLHMSAEGLPDDCALGSRKIIDTKGWRVSINKVFNAGNTTVVRRDALGRARLTSNAHLPISWKEE